VLIRFTALLLCGLIASRPALSQAISPVRSTNFQIGVNLSGMECGDPRDGNPYGHVILGTYYSYWLSQGVKTFRLPFKWERVQPALGRALDATYLGQIEQQVTYAAINGQTVLLDLHNYGTYYTLPNFGGAVNLGQSNAYGDLSGPTYTNYANVWQQLASVFGPYSNILGYDIMNEPQGLAPGVWPAAAQAAINAIRSVDTKTTIFVEGEGWASANGWAWANPTLNTLTDPSNRLVFSAHNYANQQCESFATYDSCDTPQTLVNQFSGSGNFLPWLQQNGFKGHIGEGGVGQDPRLLTMLNNSIAAYQAANVPYHYWNGGPCGSPASYTDTNLTPASFGPPATGIPPQTGILAKYIQ
jgi:endoglucanase